MTKTTTDFFDEIERQRKKYDRIKPGNIVYGSNVMPILKTFASLSSSEERENFVKALETMLADKDPNRRRFAITVCLGFVAFRDAV